MDSINWLFIATDEFGGTKPQDFVQDKGWPAEAFGLALNAKEFHPAPIPATYFFDSEGRLVEKIIGAMHREELEEKVAALK